MRQPIKFGNYLLLERIAVGGMAEVFVAKAFGVEGFERLLAIKKILPTMGEDPEFIHMFVDEARIAVQLAHANIVQVLELGKHDENLYIAMEYVSGRDLRQLIDRFRKRQEALPIPQACLIVAEVCEALDYAHRKKDAKGRPLGIVHRDVSPQNVLVSFDGEVKLIDFGIAKAESRLQKTQSGILKGKFSYMSPEQVKGRPIDGRSDVFACGVLLWELVCGEKLFTGESDFAILEKVKHCVVPEPRARNPGCPEGLQRVILKALANDPADRYQGASELHDELVPFTMTGGTVLGSRQLASWLRDEFKSEFEREQKRLRAWQAAGTPPPRRSDVPAVVVADLAQTPRDPMPAVTFLEQGQNAPPQPRTARTNGATPPRGPRELPTMKLDDAALAAAGQGRFEVAEERTVAPRKLRASPLSKPVATQKRRPGPRRWALYAGLPIALGVAGVSLALRLQRDPPAGKLIVTPSPSVPANLVVDGRPSGQLPPFVRVLSAGKHQIEVRADGYKPFSAVVDVGTGVEPAELIARLVSDRPLQLDGVVLTPPTPAEKPRPAPAARKTAIPVAAATPVGKPEVGYLVVKSRPAARLTIDGRDANRWTPIPAANPIVLPAGAHTVLLETADGQRLEEQVVVEAGKTAQLVRTLP
ncbi:MAG TPA: protein kinase [Myxococcales bacterium]|nr:protein kinase [Myxococcales bacterium]